MQGTASVSELVARCASAAGESGVSGAHGGVETGHGSRDSVRMSGSPISRGVPAGHRSGHPGRRGVFHGRRGGYTFSRISGTIGRNRHPERRGDDTIPSGDNPHLPEGRPRSVRGPYPSVQGRSRRTEGRPRGSRDPYHSTRGTPLFSKKASLSEDASRTLKHFVSRRPYRHSCFG